jgi:hypothetical protein
MVCVGSFGLGAAFALCIDSSWTDVAATREREGVGVPPHQPFPDSLRTEDALISLLTSQSPADEDLRVLNEKALPELLALYESLGDAFWLSHENRIVAATAIVKAGLKNNPPDVVVSSLLGKAQHSRTNSAGLTPVLQVVGNTAFSGVDVTNGLALRALAQAPMEIGVSTLEGIASRRAISPRPSDYFDFLKSCASELNWPLSGLSERFLICSVEWALLSGRIDLSDLTNLLKVLDLQKGPVFGRLFDSFGVLLPSELPGLISALAGASGVSLVSGISDSQLSPEILRVALLQVPESLKRHVLLGYESGLVRGSPLEALQFCKAFPAAELPLGTSAAAAVGLLGLGSRDLVDWLNELAPERRREVLSSAATTLISTGSQLSDVSGRAQAWLEAAKEIRGLSADRVCEMLGLFGDRQGGYTLSKLKGYADLVPQAVRKKVENSALIFYCANIARKGIEEIRSAINSSLESDRPLVRSQVISTLASTNYVTALSWLETEPDVATRSQLEVAIIQFGSVDMPLADRAEILSRKLASTEGSEDMAALIRPAETLALRLVDHDTSLILNLVKQMPESALRKSVMSAVSRSWATRDPVAVSEWLAATPVGASRDLAVKELVIASRDDPEVALANSMAISDPALRLEAARAVLEPWMHISEATAIEHLGKSGLSTREQEQLKDTLKISRD